MAKTQQDSRSSIHLFIWVLLILFSVSITKAQITNPNEAVILEQNKPIEQGLKGGESHFYKAILPSDHFMELFVEQKGVNVIVIVFNSEGQKIASVDIPLGIQGTEAVLLLAEKDENYQIEIVSKEGQSPSGKYQIKIKELRKAIPQDHNYFMAQQSFLQAESMRIQGDTDSLKKSIQKYQEALLIFHSLNDKGREAITLNNLGRVFEDLGEKQKARNYYEQALPLRQMVHDKSGEAVTLNNLGKLFNDIGERPKALEYFEQAITLFQAIDEQVGAAITLSNIGLFYQAQGEQKKALEYYEKSLPFCRKMNDKRSESITLNNMGGAYDKLGEKQKALEYYEQALALRRLLGDRKREATTLNNIGRVYDDLGEKQKALEYYKKALTISLLLGDKRGEAVVLVNSGAVHNDLGQIQQALDCYNKALPLFHGFQDPIAEKYVVNNIAAAYDNLGEKQQALEYYNQVLSMAKKTSDQGAEAVTLNNIGRIYSSFGEEQKSPEHYEKALEYYEKSLHLRRTIGDRKGEAITLNNLGTLYISLGNYVRALEYLNQALPLNQAVNDRNGEAATLINTGKVYIALKEEQKALDYFTTGLSLHKAVGDPNGQANALYQIASVERNQNKLANACDKIKMSLDIVEQVRANVGSKELRASYLATVQQYYEFYIDLLMQLHGANPSEHYHESALEISERRRARSLLELIAETRSGIRQGVEPKLAEREQILQQKVNSKANVLFRLKNSNSKGKETEISQLEKELNELTISFQELKTEIRQKSPRYAALTQPQTLTAKEIQQLLETDTIFLEYSLGEEKSYLWLVTANSITSYVLHKRAEIEAIAQQVYESLVARTKKVEKENSKEKRLRLAQAEKKYKESAVKLSQMLFGEITSQWKGKRLVIIADGILQYIPFAALPLPELSDQINDNKVKNSHRLTPLIVEHEIVSLPSVSILAGLRREMKDRSSAPKTIAVLADPVFEDDDPRIKTLSTSKVPSSSKASQSRQSLFTAFERSIKDVTSIDVIPIISRLPFTKQESLGILKLVSESESKKALDFEANKTTAINEEMGQYRIVHFATHGLLDSVHPELSGIVLSLVDQHGQLQDGFLRLHEIYNLNLPIELVVLSACQTGLGKDIKGEGLVGLTRGFMYAGATRVMASLWIVNDEATAELMKLYYQALLIQQLPPATALRAAQLSMWKQKRWEYPYYWAAFVLQGEWKGSLSK